MSSNFNWEAFNKAFEAFDEAFKAFDDVDKTVEVDEINDSTLKERINNVLGRISDVCKRFQEQLKK